MAGIELLSYAAGPPAGQLRSGAVASLTSIRFSMVSGGLACIAGVAATCAALPAFRRYRTETTEAPGHAREPGYGDDDDVIAIMEGLPHEAERAQPDTGQGDER